MNSVNFISREETAELIGHDDVSIVDGSWYLPAQKRNARDEFAHMRIPGAVFFDIDEISDKSSDLPHMLLDPSEFAKAVSLLGISQQNLIVVYDGPGLFSAPRVWWTLKVMGAPDVRILEGGFDRWKENGFPIETGNPNPPQPKIFTPDFQSDNVTNLESIKGTGDDTIILDARPKARFDGQAPEPRKGLRGGHIPGSKSLPMTDLVEEGKLLSSEKLELLFKEFEINQTTKTITTCGSGVTAAVLTLALAETGRINNKLYDGSWAEWGQQDGPAIETNDT